jgi:hypothetical protein
MKRIVFIAATMLIASHAFAFDRADAKRVSTELLDMTTIVAATKICNDVQMSRALTALADDINNAPEEWLNVIRPQTNQLVLNVIKLLGRDGFCIGVHHNYDNRGYLLP